MGFVAGMLFTQEVFHLECHYFELNLSLLLLIKVLLVKKSISHCFLSIEGGGRGEFRLFAHCDIETKREDPEALNYWEDLNWSEELIWKDWFERGDLRPLLVPCILIFKQFDHLQQIRQEFICSRTVPLSSSPSMRFAP